MKNKIVLYIMATIMIAGCKSNVVNISGTLENPAKGEYIFLDELKSNELKTVDSIKVSDDGTFTFKREIQSPAFYLIKTNNTNFLTMLLEPGEDIDLTAHKDSLNYPRFSFRVKGNRTDG